MNKVEVYDNGAAFCVTVNGLIVSAHNTLAGAWNHIAWMHRVASQEFVVGKNEVPVTEWIEAGIKNGFFEKNIGFHYSR